jgi:hypothetical protein
MDSRLKESNAAETVMHSVGKVVQRAPDCGADHLLAFRSELVPATADLGKQHVATKELHLQSPEGLAKGQPHARRRWSRG